MHYFLLKTEPSSYSIDDLRRDKKTSWGGVRNYQARNVIRDEMRKGDLCIIYHSSNAVPAAVGIGKIVSDPYPDPLQYEGKSEYFDPTAKITEPRWFAVDVAFVENLPQPVPLKVLKTRRELASMRLLQKGNRLSVMPLSKEHFESIKKLAAQHS